MIRNLEKYAPYFFIGPAVIMLLLIVIFPLAFSLGVSFCEWNLIRGGSWKFVGLRNYSYFLFHDPYFRTSLKVTLTFVLVAVGLELILGLGVALLLNRPLKRIGLYRTILVIPSTMTPVVVGIIWRLLYNPELGTLNYFLDLLGLPPLNWLGDPNLALPSVIMADIWEWTPFMALILLAGLQALPKDPFEAATIDGASTFQLFRYITLPLLQPTIIVATLLRVMDAFKTFDLVFVLTKGGPGMSTETLSYYTYRYGFKFFHIGYASALSYLLLVIIIIIVQIFVRYLRTGEE
ncbi:MAG: multiple sugar transport system permease protein [Candidatus Atribacteria bacterium]|nr:multiple sugar transport system permease protein [Candidatus Atribacteria bacterium]